MIKVQSESVEYPVLLDRESSNSTVYRRYDVKEKQRENEDGTVHIYYTYTEEQWTREEWNLDRLSKAAQIATKEMIKRETATPEEMEQLVDVFDDWEVGRGYKVGDVLTHDNVFYEVIQTHTSQADWTPDIVPALFKSHAPAGVIPEWQQPTGGHDAYNIGDKVTFEGEVYESLIDANTWSPTGYPAGWQVI